MPADNRLRTAAWYGDRELDLDFPHAWDVSTFWPATTPPPLSDHEIAASLEEPLGQRPIRELAAGKRRPVIIVDDLNRPTPAARVLPFVLRHLQDAGIAPADVRLVLATGTHGPPLPGGMAKKVGVEAAAACRLHVHDSRRHTRRLGRTSFGTPVRVNAEVAAADFVLGLGGIYPNHTAGFGGGTKIVLGVLGFRTIFTLHHGHASAGWGSEAMRAGFRGDVDEIARMVGLETAINVQVDQNREVVGLCSGDPGECLELGVRFSREYYQAPQPGSADVIVCNAYPGDLSLTFTRMKGTTPFRRASPTASKIVIASCPEGLGFHGLFPFLNAPRGHRARRLVLRAAMLPPGQIVHRARKRLRRRLTRRDGRGPGEDAQPAKRRPTWLYRPPGESAPLPGEIPGMRVSSSWSETLAAVQREQGHSKSLRVVVYPCASLQTMAGGSGPDGEEGE